MTVGHHHVGSHRLDANEIETVGERLPYIPHVADDLGLALDDRANRNTTLDNRHASILEASKWVP